MGLVVLVQFCNPASYWEAKTFDGVECFRQHTHAGKVDFGSAIRASMTPADCEEPGLANHHELG